MTKKWMKILSMIIALALRMRPLNSIQICKKTFRSSVINLKKKKKFLKKTNIKCYNRGKDNKTRQQHGRNIWSLMKQQSLLPTMKLKCSLILTRDSNNTQWEEQRPHLQAKSLMNHLNFLQLEIIVWYSSSNNHALPSAEKISTISHRGTVCSQLGMWTKLTQSFLTQIAMKQCL